MRKVVLPYIYSYIISTGSTLLYRFAEERIKLAESALRKLAFSLRKDGYLIGLLEGSLRAIFQEHEFRVMLKRGLDCADASDAEELASRWGGDPEIAIICWDASPSLIERAFSGEVLLLILSRMQVVGNCKSPGANALMKVMEEESLNFAAFDSPAMKSREAALSAESRAMALHQLISSLSLEKFMLSMKLRPDDLISLTHDLKKAAYTGSPEMELNMRLIKLLKLAGCEVMDELPKPGWPDVVVKSPLWAILELKNERANQSAVDQAAGYLDEVKGKLSTSGAEINWKVLLIATSADSDVISYGRTKKVAILTWRQICDFLENVFTWGLPLETLRDCVGGNKDAWEDLKAKVKIWMRELELRTTIIKELSLIGSCSIEELRRILISKGQIVSIEKLSKILNEMGGPILRLIEREGNLVSLLPSSPFSRARRLLSKLETEVGEVWGGCPLQPIPG